MFKKISIALVLLLLVVMVTGCGSQASNEPAAPAESDTIKIGVFEPLTGANAAGGAMEVEGMEIANRLYPEVLGKKIELVISDNKSDKVEAANAATRLIENDGVVAIIGSWGSSFSMAAGSIVQDAQVPAVGASCTNPLVTKDNDYYFRVCFLDPFQADILAKYAYNELGAQKAAIIREISNDYAVGLTKFFTDSFTELTGDEEAILTVVDYQTGDQDFSAQLQAVKQANPDIIFAPGNYTESALIIKQAKEQGLDVPFIGGDTWEAPEFLAIGGDAVEGAILSTFFASDFPITSESEVFLAEYEKSGQFDEPAAVTALGYDAYLVVRDAIERAGTTDSVAIRDALAETEGFIGAAGVVSLDENGDAVKDVVVKQVQDGKFVYLHTIKAGE